MYWFVTFKDGKQKVVKVNNGNELSEKLIFENVLSIIKLSDDIFENLSEQ